MRRMAMLRQLERDIPIKYKMNKLAKEANKYHCKAVLASQTFIDYVRQSGEALNKAKALMKYGSWKKWLKDNFDASYETAVNYMRIARDWDADCLK